MTTRSCAVVVDPQRLVTKFNVVQRIANANAADRALKSNGTKSYAKVQRHDRSTTKMLLNQLRQQRADFVAERSDIAICAAIA
jgi:hypothetical protein